VTQYVFMNEQIRLARPKRPVIVCQDRTGHQVEANLFEIVVDGKVVGRVKYADGHFLGVVETHDVKAWVEFEDGVTVRPVGQQPEQLPLPLDPNGPGPAYDPETEDPRRTGLTPQPASEKRPGGNIIDNLLRRPGRRG
jgi:hypothetical protein